MAASIIQSHVKKPTSSCLSDLYFAEDGTPAKGSLNRLSITTSEQLLWSLFQIMMESNGNVSKNVFGVKILSLLFFCCS